jgi:hypothetical protein
MSGSNDESAWQIIEHRESFEITTKGIALAYIYFEDEPVRREMTRRLTKAQAEWMAHQIARIPEFLKRP